MKRAAEKHLTAAASYIAVAESGDSKRAAYERAADEILAAQAEDPALTQVMIAKRLKRDRTWVVKLLAWRRRDEQHTLPFANADAVARYAERQVPTRHEDKVEMVETLLADRTVAAAVVAGSSEGSRRVQHAVYEKDRERSHEMFEQYREHQEARARAMPGLPAHMAAMVIRVNEWSAGLADITDDDLSGLPEGRGRELVGEAIEELIRQATRWRKALKRKATLHVIEGKAAARG